MNTLLEELNWANLIALLTVVSGIVGTWWINANNRRKQAADSMAATQAAQIAARKDVAAAWEEFCEKQQNRIDQLARQLERYELRITALEAELERTRLERDTERCLRQELERKVTALEKEIEALRQQANRVNS